MKKRKGKEKKNDGASESLQPRQKQEREGDNCRQRDQIVHHGLARPQSHHSNALSLFLVSALVSTFELIIRMTEPI